MQLGLYDGDGLLGFGATEALDELTVEGDVLGVYEDLGV